MAPQTFNRWARLGVWERLLGLVQERGVQLGMAFVDGTSVRAHQKAAGAARKGELQQSETVVKHLSAVPASRRGIGRSPMAALVVAMGARLA